MTMPRTFVTKIVAVYAGRPQKDFNHPSVTEVRELVADLGIDGAMRLDLYDEPETTSMTVFAEDNAFHLTISVEESTNYYYSNGGEANDELIEIAGHLFDSTQICHDRALAEEMILAFWKQGERLPGVEWEEEALDE
jgi:hypothetical protein